MEQKIYENFELIESVLDNKYTIDDYKSILNRFNDEKSKLNLFYRVMYDNTNDAKYALMLELNMYRGTSFINQSDVMMYHFLEFMLKNDNYNKKIFIIGFPFDSNHFEYNKWGVPCVFNHRIGALDVKCIFDKDFGYVFENAEKNVEVRNIEDIYNLQFSDDMIFIFYNNCYGKEEAYLRTKISNDNIFIFNKQMIFARNGQYFFEDFIKFSSDEIFLDGGAYCLETSIDFINIVKGKYKKIYAVEPEKNAYNECPEIIRKRGYQNIQLENVGLWSSDTVLRFDCSIPGSSNINGNGSIEISCKSIDSILDGNPITIIKMDIEGSEYEALLGAKNSITKYCPMLMICVYHKPNDVLKLTKLILSMRDNYKLYLRQYSFSRNETVLYCIPNEK